LQLSTAAGAARRSAAILRGSWRDGADSDLTPDDLSDLVPLLLGAGVAPLVHRRLGAQHPELRDAARLSVLHAAARTARVKRVIALFRDAGVEPLVGKGWAVAGRFYPDPALRPSSDIDLFVSPEDYDAALRLVRLRGRELAGVDLHRGCEELGDRSWSAIAEKRIELRADETPVSVFCDEHHLRLLALHFVKHAGFRPLWLCDVAALVERQRATLDWEEVMRGQPWRTSWVVGVVALARDLLGADVAGTPAEHVRVPSWATEAILREWETPYRWPAGRPPALKAFFARGLVNAARELRARWPSPVEASFNFRGALNETPRLPYELLQLIWQSLAVPRQLIERFGASS
jgi:hypothetical protein